ncbi:hypothetical protein [Salimicrobium flavidum]|uniref:PD-(D/E)XK nuclease superfamily protein n=1 Tax=Salimicrobium flavidum TaxID=570947 RepID=A0A1N7IWS7_9BACI|nr:hypothetical protein [Salimicrobium flavidum]SIS41553.1 hypothetical protein SAMN05421687_102381 [Salimicrobium flavidum]
MSEIHYFPRYSQKENMVTNNTLLLFSRLYQNNPKKFTLFINSVLDDDKKQLNTTVKFSQQEKSRSGRVADGMISQDSFKVVIETKLYGQEHIDQVIGHWNSFENEDNQVFLWINKEPITNDYYNQIINELNDYNNKNGTNIKFASTTFKEICYAFKDVLQEYDLEMTTLIEDYENFCNETGLIDNNENRVRVVLTGKTFAENMKYKLYFHPKNRGYQNAKYIGLYQDKAIRAIGEVSGIVDLQYDESNDDFIYYKDVKGKSTQEIKNQIKDITKESKTKHGYPAEEDRRFFIVEEYHQTEYKKTSHGGLPGVRYIDLLEVNGYEEDMRAMEIADLLKGKEWDVL